MASTLSLRGFLNLAYITLYDLLPDPTWDFDAKGKPRNTRQGVVRALAWPDELAEDDARSDEAEAEEAMVSAKGHGIGVSEKQMLDAWKIYSEAMAEREAKQQPGAEASD